MILSIFPVCEGQDVPQAGHAAPEGRDVQAGHGRPHRLPPSFSGESP